MATATAATWAMAMVTRLVGNKEGKAESSKGNGDSDEAGGQQRGQGQQGNGNSDTGGRQSEGNSNNVGNDDEDKGCEQ